MNNMNLPRDHWRMVLPASLREPFIRLIAMAKQDKYLQINDLRDASANLGKRKNFVGLQFVVWHPFLVCRNRQSGAGWREPYYLFTTLTASYAFRFPEEELLKLPSHVEPSENGFFKMIAELDAVRASVEFEKNYLLACLQLSGGKKASACRLSGMSRASFYRKISEFRALGIWPE